MAAITEIKLSNAVKALFVGKPGSGKTGAKAALICAGYKIRSIDSDKGSDILANLLTHPKYPYASYIKAHGIDISKSLDVVRLDLGMEVGETRKEIGSGRFVSEMAIKPRNSVAWTRLLTLLSNWKDGSSNYGPVTTWGDDTVLDIDTLSTLSKSSYYFIQDLNKRLGARDEGYDYQRDVGGAQSQITRLLELLNDSSIKCNVLVNTHINWVDESRGFAQSPDQVVRAGNVPDVTGLPAAIGRALSPQIGKYFNNCFICREQGPQRRIYTTQTEGVSAKTSTYLEPHYDISTGLAEIFAALRNQPPPTELIEAIRKGGTRIQTPIKT